jgi:hypothetical protein
MKPKIIAVAAGALLLAVSGQAQAHHSGAMFDRTKTITLSGVIKDYNYTQPHSWIDIIVPGANGAAPVTWGVEGGAPPAMRNQGLTPSTVKAGDKAEIRVHPFRDGRPGGSLVDVAIGGKPVMNQRGGGGREQIETVPD